MTKDFSKLSDKELFALIGEKPQPIDAPQDFSSMSDEELFLMADIQPEKKGETFFEENIARPVLRATKSSVAGLFGGAADVANLAAELPIYAGTKLKEAFTGENAPYKPVFANGSVTEAINERFDRLTGGLTKDRGASDRDWETLLLI